MKIHGLQKMTLLDYPGQVACTVFLAGCDFRCPFCHNYDLALGRTESVMDDRELLRFLEKRRGLLDGVAFTGGEPLLHKGLPELMRSVRSLGFRVKLDTNGYHPEALSAVLSEGLADYVAMDIKNSPAKYALTAGLDCAGGLAGTGGTGGTGGPVPVFSMDRILKSIRILMESGTDYEFRTTVVQELHEESDFPEMGKMIRGARRYFLQAFTDRDSVPFKFSAPSAEQLQKYAALAAPYVREVQVRGV